MVAVTGSPRSGRLERKTQRSHAVRPDAERIGPVQSQQFGRAEKVRATGGILSTQSRRHRRGTEVQQDTTLPRGGTVGLKEGRGLGNADGEVQAAVGALLAAKAALAALRG